MLGRPSDDHLGTIRSGLSPTCRPAMLGQHLDPGGAGKPYPDPLETAGAFFGFTFVAHLSPRRPEFRGFQAI